MDIHIVDHSPAITAILTQKINNHMEGAVITGKTNEFYRLTIPDGLLEESRYNNQKFYITKNRSFMIIERNGVWMALLQ